MQRINLVAALMPVFSKHAAGETQFPFQGVVTRGAPAGALELVRLAQR